MIPGLQASLKNTEKVPDSCMPVVTTRDQPFLPTDCTTVTENLYIKASKLPLTPNKASETEQMLCEHLLNEGLIQEYTNLIYGTTNASVSRVLSIVA